MTQAEVNTLRKSLETTRTELDLQTHNRGLLVIETSPDEMDRIQSARDRDYSIGNLERNSTRKQDVMAALGRIADGTFGLCMICEEPISSKRMTAIPWASACIACQEAADIERKAPRSEFEAPLEMAA